MSNLIRRSSQEVSPWRDLLSLDNFFDRSWPTSFSKLPAVNIAEDEKAYSIEVIAPGFQKGDFKLKVDDDVLTISAESQAEKSGNGKGRDYTRREYSYSSFTRSFNLPENVKDDAISASYADGILKLELPKSETQVKLTKEIPIR